MRSLPGDFPYVTGLENKTRQCPWNCKEDNDAVLCAENFAKRIDLMLMLLSHTQITKIHMV